MADTVNILVRVRDATAVGIAEVNARLNTLVRNANTMDKSFGRARGAAISLAPALIPIAAAAVPIAASMAAAGAAVGAFGAAVIPQALAMKEAADAEKKYTEAVEEHGRSSKEAAEAEKKYLTEVRKLPPATREAAAGLSVLKDQYKAWSNELSGDTMPVATKSFAVFGALLPKLTPMVRGAAGELNRFMTIAAGGIQSESFDRFMASFSEFATGALKRANDGLIRLARTMDTGKVSGGLSEFMQYVRENGPLVGDALKNIAQALTKLLVAGSDVGVGLLSVVNAFASLVASLPTGLVTTLLQVAIAFKAVKIAAAGFSVVSAGILAVTTQITAMRTAAAGATTRIAALSLAFRALSVTAKLAVASTGIGLLLVLLMELSQMGKSTPPNVDRLTTALGKLGSTGKVTGEAAKAFGADLGKLKDQINKVTDPSIAESVNNWGHDVTNGILAAGDATEEVTQSFDAIDEALSNLVRGGKADLAGAALANMLKGMNSEQVEKLRGSLDNYDAALADAAFEQKLAADSMGVFGAQAIEVQGKLDAQKQSVAGLQQSVHALNNTYLQSRGDVRAMEAAIDAATEALKKNGKTLDENTEKGRDNNQKLDDIAATTMKAVEAKYLETGSWEAALEVYKRGRGALDVAAAGMARNKEAAKALADQILKTPDKTAMLKGDLTDLQAKLADAKQRLSTVPDSRKAAVRAEISQLTAKIAKAKAELASLHDKKVTLTMIERRIIETSRRNVGPTGELAHGGIIGAQGGGPRSRQTLVGEQGPELVDLAPGSRVHSNPDTRRMAANWSGSSGGQPFIIQLSLGTDEIAEVLVDPMRRTVSRRGGVVATFGKL